MKAFLKKLTSRKFLAMVVGVVTGLATAFGLDGDTITSVSGAVVACASVITYIMAEGRVDAAAVKKAVEAAEAAREELEGTNETA